MSKEIVVIVEIRPDRPCQITGQLMAALRRKPERNGLDCSLSQFGQVETIRNYGLVGRTPSSRRKPAMRSYASLLILLESRSKFLDQASSQTVAQRAPFPLQIQVGMRILCTPEMGLSFHSRTENILST